MTAIDFTTYGVDDGRLTPPPLPANFITTPPVDLNRGDVRAEFSGGAPGLPPIGPVGPARATKARMEWVRRNPGRFHLIGRDMSPGTQSKLKDRYPDLVIVTRNQRCDESTDHRRICDLYAAVRGTVEGQVA